MKMKKETQTFEHTITLQEFIVLTNAPLNQYNRNCCVRPRVVCENGYSISIQASMYHYCEPRESMETTYTHLELGFPNNDDYEALLTQYDGDGDSVYGYVPCETVDNIITLCGGIKSLQY
jgi:hypothetical protein